MKMVQVMSARYPSCPYTMLYLDKTKGPFLRLKSGIRQGTIMPHNKVKLLIIESLKIVDGPLTMVIAGGGGGQKDPIALVLAAILHIEPAHDKTNKMTAPKEESNQHGYPPSLISLRCALTGLLRIQGFCLRTVLTAQTGQIPWLI